MCYSPIIKVMGQWLMWEKGQNWRRNCHAQRNKTVQERFWEKVDKTGCCWEWLAAKDKDGYGFFRHEGKNKKAHRFIFELDGVDIPKDSMALHHCDNPSCVNPDHLYIGTSSDNQKDATFRGRHHSVKLCPEDVRRIRDIRKCGASGPKIANYFNVSCHTVYAIEHKKKWAYVD